MKSRERVLLALNHQEPDHVPLFKPNIMDTREAYDQRVQDFLGRFSFDRLVSLEGLLNPPEQKRELSEDIFVDGYGCRYKYEGFGLPYCIHSPLAEAETVADVEAFDWPDPQAPGMIADDAREKAKRVRQGGKWVTTVGVAPIFHQYHYIRGFEQWMMDVRLNPAVHRAIADHIYHINTTLAMRLLEKVGEYTDVVMIADDFGWSSAPYMSPKDFGELITPYYVDLVGEIKGRYPHIKFYLHSHGQIMDLVPDLVDCGVDILNPLLPLDNMDPVRLKKEFGQRLCFHGGIDVEQVMPFGTVEEVRAHVRETMDILAPGGGYWFKAQVISPLIPADNLIAAYELAREYGRYGSRS